MSTQLTEDEIAEIKEAFDLFDQDGQLSVEHISTVMTSLGRSKSREEIEEMMASCGIEGQVNSLDFAQFLMVIAEDFQKNREAEMTAEREVQIRQIFGLFDRNDDGQIDASELGRVMALMGDEISDQEAIKMIKEADLDGDGKVSLDEFLTMMNCK